LRKKRKKSRGFAETSQQFEGEGSGGMLKCNCKYCAHSKKKRGAKQRLTIMPLTAKKERITDDSSRAIAVLQAALQREALDIG
jgi:hypothetical protein